MSISRHFTSRVGLYYLIFRDREDETIFFDDTGCRHFIDLLASVLAETGYRLYAFCLLPAEIHMAVGMSHTSLADFTQRLILKFKQKERQKQRPARLLCDYAADPKFFDGEEKLRELIRFIHLLPLKQRQDPAEYPWSGHRTYVGKARIPGVETRRGLRLFGPDCRQAREAYQAHFTAGLKAVREKRPLASDQQALSSMIISLEQLAVRVGERAGKSVYDIRSNSRERNLSLLRAVLTWHASRMEVATMTEISRYLNRDPSTLYVSVKRYTFLYPHLFEEPGELKGLTSIASVRVNGRMIADVVPAVQAM